VNAITDLFGRPLADFTTAMGPEVGRRLYYSVEAYRVRGPVVEPNRQVVIPRGPRTYALDFETSDDVGPIHVQPPHCWLSGVWDFQTGGTHQFIARGPGEEAGMLTRLADHIGDPASACVLCWTLYEVGVLQGAAQRHPHLAPRLLALAAACVDLKNVVKQQVYLPVPNYSIKQVAPALGFHWRHKGYGAFAAMTDYWRWVGGADGPLMDKAFDYHEDDLISMERVVRALDGLQGSPPTP
jgi:predicted RecB family nuclease